MSNMVYSSDNYEVEVNEKLYRCAVEAFATAVHEPGTMYRRNGDPGDPPVDEFTIDKLEVTDVSEVVGNGFEIPVGDENIIDGVKNKIETELLENEWLWTRDESEQEEG